MKKPHVLLLLTGLVLSACVSPTQTVPATPEAATNEEESTLSVESATAPPAVLTTATLDIEPETLAYLQEAISIMEENSLNRDKVNWEALKAKVFIIARGAHTPSDTYAVIESALADLGDRHSVFLTPLRVKSWQGGEHENPLPEVKLLDNNSNIGYIKLPGYSGDVGEKSNEYATAVHAQISEVDAQNPCGWIVDLRSNGGGNMWPMLASIGPILGEGRIGSYVYPSGSEELWYYDDGRVLLDDEMMVQVEGAAYQLNNPLPPVAVLFNRSTASSGEAVAIAFRGRPNTRSFGEDTASLTTNNEPFELSDGAMMMLTIAVFADRTGEAFGYNIRVNPDRYVRSGVENLSKREYTLQVAARWLLEQDTCSAIDG